MIQIFPIVNNTVLNVNIAACALLKKLQYCAMFDYMNSLGKRRLPFFFIVDFEKKCPQAIQYADINPQTLLFKCGAFQNGDDAPAFPAPISLNAPRPDYALYADAFRYVRENLAAGNSYLLNLTCAAKIETALTLRDFYSAACAPYKLWIKDKFVVFSPEQFICINNNVISTFPMKGTIDAALPDAERLLLNNEKETAEHLTVVDLLRNDLSIVAKNVRVRRYRFLSKIRSNDKNLLQLSSEISGALPEDWHENIGTILDALLPAGSVSGAPKKKTLEIIGVAEREPRGYYTGVFGFFDGHKLDSAVMIRFIEQRPDGLYYRCGGGVTVYSSLESEYQECMDKIYVPMR